MKEKVKQEKEKEEIEDKWSMWVALKENNEWLYLKAQVLEKHKVKEKRKMLTVNAVFFFFFAQFKTGPEPGVTS